MAKKLIIVGAGISGLAAGCYGQMNGYETTILEMHDAPGGLCASWERDGYTFNGCIHWVVGVSPNSRLNQYWQEIGALSKQPIYSYDELMRVEGYGKTLIFYTNLDALKDHLLQLAPEDSLLIEELITTAKELAHLEPFQVSAHEMQDISERLEHLREIIPYASTFMKNRRLSVQEYANR